MGSTEGLSPKVVLEHELVPKHEIMSKTEAEEILKNYGIKPNQLPKIKIDDPVAKAIKAKKGDIVKITRASATAGEAIYYRVAI